MTGNEIDSLKTLKAIENLIRTLSPIDVAITLLAILLTTLLTQMQ
jgi:hypothetical protein